MQLLNSLLFQQLAHQTRALLAFGNVGVREFDQRADSLAQLGKALFGQRSQFGIRQSAKQRPANQPASQYGLAGQKHSECNDPRGCFQIEHEIGSQNGNKQSRAEQQKNPDSANQSHLTNASSQRLQGGGYGCGKNILKRHFLLLCPTVFTTGRLFGQSGRFANRKSVSSQMFRESRAR